MSAAFAETESTLAGQEIVTLSGLYEAAGGLNFIPGWVPRKKPILWSEPRPELVPAHWTYAEAKAGLDAAGRLIDVSLAERRNLVMRNPAPGTNFVLVPFSDVSVTSYNGTRGTNSGMNGPWGVTGLQAVNGAHVEFAAPLLYDSNGDSDNTFNAREYGNS